MDEPVADVPLLRAPPFPGPRVILSEPVTASLGTIDAATVERLFAALRAERVGGSYWAPPGTVAARIDRAAAPARETVDPWSVLSPGVTVRGHGDDEWIALAQIVGARVELTAPGRYDTPERVAATLLARRYRDPFTGVPSDLESVIALLGLWRRLAATNRAIVAACGIAWWKRREIRRFLWSPGRPLRFYRSERRAVTHAARVGGAVAVWPSRVSAAMVRDAAASGVTLIRVEDGFVRSVGLGSDLVPPASITVDARGIHYDPSSASDLEQLLAAATFAPTLLARAARLRETMVATRISKYGGGAAHTFPTRAPGRRLVLVPGQVEDDMSVRLGGHGLASNLELLRRARALEPDAEIWFRPHPDVDAGHRRGAVRDAEALTLADHVVRGGAMADLLDVIDGVHVLTSLTGFEALLRARDVTCHGTPFYAGWGLTRDLAPVPDRRGRALRLDELVAGVMILYPRYLDPVTALPCPPETLVARMATGGAVNRLDRISRLRRWQGRVARRWR
ncbi:beta-3-deoxy-D-manno-oct-2-ulosonic acid transferase [Sphingomonas sp. RHCKR7]|uniref:capsular polysaccharide export protein, LipB/KpsS family n=1 Tax=Sphingomonas folli TaxID=2862497 RepID=UPI001CA5A9C6|nr:beta-3-deoxy-D-manno-oct-2-ulosonic acid transferase [Sphingomonas folli]MBW6526779.1 beta-3-deoxy-D-manno-oct-2-ulosonic acid transferase [Sphingomonas folli]